MIKLIFRFYVISLLFLNVAKADNCTEYNIQGSGVLALMPEDNNKSCVLDHNSSLLFDSTLADYKIFEPPTETIGCLVDLADNHSSKKLVIEQFHWRIQEHPVRRVTMLGKEEVLLEINSSLSGLDGEVVFVSTNCMDTRPSKIFKLDQIIVERKPK